MPYTGAGGLCDGICMPTEPAPRHTDNSPVSVAGLTAGASIAGFIVGGLLVLFLQRIRFGAGKAAREPVLNDTTVHNANVYESDILPMTSVDDDTGASKP